MAKSPWLRLHLSRSYLVSASVSPILVYHIKELLATDIPLQVLNELLRCLKLKAAYVPEYSANVVVGKADVAIAATCHLGCSSHVIDHYVQYLVSLKMKAFCACPFIKVHM